MRGNVNGWAKLGDFCSHRYWSGLRSVTPFVHLHRMWFVTKVGLLNSRFYKETAWLEGEMFSFVRLGKT